MIEPDKGSEWIFVIDTDQYSGNFEREMCAYITGIVGDCGVGNHMANIAQQELTDSQLNKFEETVAQVSDDHGCYRPVTIVTNPNWFNDGMGNYWKNDDSDIEKQLNAYAQAIVNYETPHIERAKQIFNDLTLGKKVLNWTIRSAREEWKRCQDKIDAAKTLKKTYHYPAYLSVGIWFDKKPTKTQISLMKTRAFKFQDAKHQYPRYRTDTTFTVNIEGFRLIHNLKSSLEEKV